MNEFKESAVGNLVTSAQLAIAKKSGYDVDFAMTNDGGIRADLKVQEDGTVTWEQHKLFNHLGISYKSFK